MKIFKTIVALSLACQLGQAQTTIRIDASKPGAKINPDLYGVFFEEINHAVEGGLYGEMIRNRGFEDNRMPEGMSRKGDFLNSPQGWIHRYPQPDSLAGWELSVLGNAQASAKQVATNPLNEQTPMSAEIKVIDLGSGSVKFSNKGFWGINVVQGQSYKLSLYARSSNMKSPLEVRLETPEGKIIASQKIKGIGSEWTKFNGLLTASESHTQARLVLAPTSTGTIWFDMVSLFPSNTYKKRDNGLRLDIASLIEGIHPGFLRFPGGCIVEGATMDNRVKWENTIGDPAKRPGHWVLWDYHSSDGIGFHEYLQFCEDLKCAPMYVIPVGLSCQFRKPEHAETEELQPYIDEALDALEYALGPVNSKWGAERAKNGHPEPFNIKYLEIGNENYGPIYHEHYNLFYRAIKAKYPQLKTIACTDPGMRAPFNRSDLAGITEPIEMIDEHFYESPDFFYKNATRYDLYNRKGPKVYVGEYAVKKWDNSLRGNLDASLAEAAFMTGFERNADIVELSSMAPTFINLNDQTWNPDLIAYNNSTAYGNPAYHVQKLFASNLPDRVLPVSCSFDNTQTEEINKGWGFLGMNHFDVDAEYKDIVVTVNGKVYKDNSLFDESTLKKAKNGVFSGKRQYLTLPFKQEVYKEAASPKWTDYSLRLKARATSMDDLESLIILFYSTGENKHYKWNLSRWHRWSWLEWYDNGFESYFAQKPGNIELNRWYEIEIRVKNDSIQCLLDHQLVHKVAFPKKVVPGMYTSAGVKDNGDIIMKVVNATAQQQETNIEIPGVNLKADGTASTITNADRFAGNSIEKPENVSAQTSTLSGVDKSFKYKFLPHSITVLTFKKQ